MFGLRCEARQSSQWTARSTHQGHADQSWLVFRGQDRILKQYLEATLCFERGGTRRQSSASTTVDMLLQFSQYMPNGHAQTAVLQDPAP